MRVICETVGLEELRDTLSNLTPKESSNLMRWVMKGLSDELADNIKTSAPAGKKAELKGAIYSKRGPKQDGVFETQVRIRKVQGRTIYHFVEFGTIFKSAHPFIVPPVERMASRIKELFEERFFRKLAKILRKRARLANK